MRKGATEVPELWTEIWFDNGQEGQEGQDHKSQPAPTPTPTPNPNPNPTPTTRTPHPAAGKSGAAQ
jgi:hypothetical protein